MSLLFEICFIIIISCFLWTPIQAQYEDVRCKCVCSAHPNPNGTKSGRSVFVLTVHKPTECKCENVVDMAYEKDFCSLCDCKWERRNTTTIKVVVMIIISVIALLVLYMVFLLCLDPLLSRKPRAYLQQHNEELDMDTQNIIPAPAESGGARARPGELINRVKYEVNKVKGEQQKWKGTVKEQRRHIYDTHTMLN